MSTTSTPRPARFDLPPAPSYSATTATDTGLSEWANKIKAMQRQVDADDEAEQRRLEEEIVRARLARMRRSRTGQGGDFGMGMHGIDLSKVQEGSPRTGKGDLEASSEKSSAPSVPPPKPAMKSTSTGAKTAPMSLAAFMGGSAPGPRLRRHEPQPDAGLVYDGRGDHGPVHPIFGRGGVAMPGMAGRDTDAAPVSLPASISSPQPHPSQSFTPLHAQAASSEPSRARTLSSSNVARRYVEKIEEATSQSSSPKFATHGVRERRQSTPHGTFSEPRAVPTPSTPSRPLSQNLGGRGSSPAKSSIVDSRRETLSTTDIRPKTPTASELRPKMLLTDSRPRTAPIIDVRSKTPTADVPSTNVVVDEPRAKTPGTDVTRAKPRIQSSPTRSSFSGTAPWQTPRHQPSAQVPSTSTVPPKSPGPPSPVRGTHAPQPQRSVAPAFLRLPMGSATKDPTPSISRLQGRGFVQSIVQASDRVSKDTQGSPSPASKHVFPSTSPAPSHDTSEMREKGARRASVLDRWAPVMNAGNTSTPSSPLPASKSATPTRSHTVYASAKSGSGQEENVPAIKTHDTGRSVRTAVSLPALPKTPQKKSDGFPAQEGKEKLGSSSTMISYIKPIKTGDDPVIPYVDELGIKASEGGMQAGGAGPGTDVNSGVVVGTPGKAKTPRASVSPLPSSPGKPLSHPTKDRAKKPRKARVSEETRPGDGSVPAAPSSHPATTGTETLDLGVPISSDPGSTQDDVAPPARTSPSGSVNKVTDRWTEPTLIGVKPMPPSSATAAANRGGKPAGTAGMFGRRALPGLANPGDKDAKPMPMPMSMPMSMSKDGERRTVSPSPTRHARIPSTGNRALVMDVAQALNEAARQQPPPQEDDKDRENPKELAAVTAGAAAGLARQAPSAGLAAERRKASHERYSAIAMPPLAEVRTPVASPVNTMARRGVAPGAESPWGSLRANTTSAAVRPGPPSAPPTSPSAKVHIEHLDTPLPRVDVAMLLQAERPTAGYVPNPDLRTVEVEVMSVVHANAVPVQRDTSVFYDGEVLVIVHRAKSRESGLVASKAWCWSGSKCRFGEKEEKKVGEIARRYGTSADMVDQQREPAELVHVLGGRLAIRQGTRAHWSSENTAMHVVRSVDGHILIHEMDLSIRNLCSGYSYCVTILDNIYVWHGCGSVAAERTAALRYAQDIAAKGTSVKELVEGENDKEDEMFWMVVGDSESYAKADYWKWRSSVVPPEPRCWLVDVTNTETPIHPVPTVLAETVQQDSVYIIDCFWEFFVLVGKDARAKRLNITLGINTAVTMAPFVAASKPFSPTVHVLILPTRLPLDMRHAFRNLDELALNGGFIPDHMNILSTQEAIEHLRTSSWDRSALRDHTMLPLGLDSSHVPLP